MQNGRRDLGRKDFLTIPNGITVARLLATPFMVRYFYSNPHDALPLSGLFAASDNVDGFLARLGNRKRFGSFFQKIGCRTSELGRKIDPLADKVYTVPLIGAAILNNTLQAPVGAAALLQKGINAGVSVFSESRGVDINVSRIGKLGEFVTNWGIGLSIMNSVYGSPDHANVLQYGATAVTAGGICLGAAAGVGYARQYRLKKSAPQQDLPTEQTL